MRWLVIVLLLAIGAIAWLRLKPGPKNVGDTVSSFTIDTINRRAFSLESLKDKTKCFIFFSVDDDESTEFFKMANFLTRPIRGLPNVRVIAVASKSTPDRVKLYLSQFPFEGEVLIDSEGTFTESMRVSSFPTFFVADHDNVITYRAIGWDRDYIRECIQAVKTTEK